jgi:hypothetical protein
VLTGDDEPVEGVEMLGVDVWTVFGDRGAGVPVRGDDR